MITPQENLKTTLGLIFDRKGGAGEFTNRFESFSPAERLSLLEGVILERDELPVVAGRTSDANGLIITTKRILQFEKTALLSIAIPDICEVTPVNFGRVEKTKMEQLSIKTNNSGHMLLKVEAGKPYFGIWNMLLNVVSRNRVHR